MTNEELFTAISWIPDKLMCTVREVLDERDPDFYTALVALVTRCRSDEVTRDQRTVAKTAMFYRGYGGRVRRHG